MIELTYAKVPRMNKGFYVTRNHYHNHIISINLYLGNGRKFEITVVKGFGIRFMRFI